MRASIALLLSCLVVVGVYAAYRRITRISLSHIRGPVDEASFLLELYRGDAAAADLKWQKTYGDVSDAHKRQRKIMLPGFGTPEARSFLPIFFSTANKLGEKWKNMISGSGDDSVVLNVPYWLSRATLDVIGEAAFDYRFGGLDDEKNELANAYTTLLTETFGSPSLTSIFIISTWIHLPAWLRHLFQRKSARLHHARETENIGNRVAKSLIDAKAYALSEGKGSKDIMSLLVQSNNSENEKTRMSVPEMLAQMRTIMLAGHETTANTLNWTLLEICKQPHIQRKLRAEIWRAENELRASGRVEFEVSDFENMPYTTAVVKEALRFHPVLHLAFRTAGRDDVLPLSTPLRTSDGTVITELPVPKGLKIVASITGNKKVFGEDADVFNPERWLRPSDGKKQSVVGVYANVLYELHAFIIELISNFEFELTPEAEHIRRHPCLVVAPTIEGREDEGAQLPLRVRIAVKGE
ncbi:hypothetical protein EYR36_003977 [Pleurotus pulmonarius]|nr:hypothetical protein EYR36_003977 [Pleurotus pulmonarius]